MTKEQLLAIVDELSRRARPMNSREIREIQEGVLKAIGKTLEIERGRKAGPYIQRASTPVDTLTELGGVGLGVEFATNEVEESLVNRVIGYVSTYGDFSQLLVFGLKGFDSAAKKVAGEIEPVRVELIDFARLRSWIGSLENPQATHERTRLESAVNQYSRGLAEIVASDPTQLDNLEWRDVERMLAAALEELGFKVELTPPAKDGGRDIVLRCEVYGEQRKYFVEVKHWSSHVGQGVVKDFVRVVIDENAEHGLILATTGYTSNAFEQLTEFERRRVKGKDRETMIAICRAYERRNSGLISAIGALPDLLFNGTV